jgi:hypothetical protein
MLAALPRRLTLVIGAALLTAAACSDSTGPVGSLTPEETNELARQMGVGLTADLAASASASADGPRLSAVPEPLDGDFTVTAPCPRSGRTRITGSVDGTFDYETESGVIDVTATQTPEDCGFDVHGKVIRVTGSLTATAHVELANGLPVGTHTATLVGEFSWRASDGRRGSCSVNYTATANYTTNVGTVNGTFCGTSIQVTGPLTG